jgi:replicative superfamily II helicase
MSVTDQSLAALRAHWALTAIGEQRFQAAMDAARFRFVSRALGESVKLSGHDAEDELLERVATACELAAAEGIQDLLHPRTDDESKQSAAQAMSGAYEAFELRRVLPVPPEIELRVLHVLHAGALAYASDRWTELRQWLADDASLVSVPDAAVEPWDRRVLVLLFGCWVRLFRKNGWKDLSEVAEIVASLREQQRAHEAAYLETPGETPRPVAALRLIALYHWAKATEQLATYMLQGQPGNIASLLDAQLEAGLTAAESASDAPLTVLLRWLHVAARQMVQASVWTVTQMVNSRVTDFVREAVKGQLIELLPPQRAAIREQGLLDSARRAVVVNLPTSGGKTALAQFRILQALNQFNDRKGWVAYVAPTRALVAQITRRLRRDFGSIVINVEQLTAAVDLDAFEERLLSAQSGDDSFHVLVATPEKLNIVINRRAITRPLALAVIDEAHNIEDNERGLRIELLLATIKRQCLDASFLLLMPFVPNSNELANWLEPGTGANISLGTTAWRPNERLVGVFEMIPDNSERAGWRLEYETLTTTTQRTTHLRGKHRVDGVKPLGIPMTKAKSLAMQAGAMSRVFGSMGRGTSVAVVNQLRLTWSVGAEIAKSLPALSKPDENIELVRRFVATEVSPDFALSHLLEKGVAVHHSGLSEETRALVEWLAEQNSLRVLCATMGVAQGINFPIGSVFLSTRSFGKGEEMTRRAFWNLAGRAGRVGQDSVGVVGIAAGNNRADVVEFVKDQTEELLSQLVAIVRKLSEADLGDMKRIIHRDEWAAFRSYIAHLFNELKHLNAVLAAAEQTLRETLGYRTLEASRNAEDRKRAKAILNATRAYAAELSEYPENATLADATGFDPDGVRAAIIEMGKLEHQLQPSDWQPGSIFGNTSVLPQLVGVMLKVPQLKDKLNEIAGSRGLDQRHIADIAKDWVQGRSLVELAQKYFMKDASADLTVALGDACKGIYKTLANFGTWGLAALSQMGPSGLDFDNMSEAERRTINNLPAMLYHGVSTESAVLLRMNSVPRSIAPALAANMEADLGSRRGDATIRLARDYLKGLNLRDWERAKPQSSTMSAADYREVWRILSGERG